MEISDVDAAWAAGFLDGEGTFTIHLDNRNVFVAIVSVSNTDVNPLQSFKEWFGGSFRATKIRSVNHKQLYTYTATSRNAIALIKVVRPYLRLKGVQADVLLQLNELIENGRGAGWELTIDELRSRVALKARITELNKRGVG